MAKIASKLIDDCTYDQNSAAEMAWESSGYPVDYSLDGMVEI